MPKAPAYLADIETLTQASPVASQRELLKAVTDIFLVTEDNQSEADNAALSEVMERISYALDDDARSRLAQRIAGAQRVSRQLARRLANDEIGIARPMLEQCRALSDTDLSEIIQTRSPEHLHSIAGREQISPEITDQILDTCDDQTLARLTRNHGAAISEAGFGKITMRAGENPQLMAALGERGDLPDAVVQIVQARIGRRVKSDTARAAPEVDDKFISALIEHCSEAIPVDCSSEAKSQIDDLHRRGANTEADVVRYARRKRIPELVYSLSLFSGIDSWTISQCMLRAELPAFAILCKAQGFSTATFLALAEVRRGRAAVPSSKIARAMRDYEALPVATAERIMDHLKARLADIRKASQIADANPSI